MHVKINLRKLWMIFIFIPFFEPRYFSDMAGMVHYVYLGWKVIACFLMFGDLIVHNKLKAGRRNTYKWLFFSIFVTYKIVSFFSMVVNGRVGLVNILNLCSAVVLTAFIIFSLDTEKARIDTLQILSYLLNTIFLLNEIVNFIHPNGFGTDASGNSVYFWNTRNHMFSLLLAAIVINLMYSYYKYQSIKIFQKIVITAMILETIHVWSATAIMGIGIFMIIVILLNRRFTPIDCFMNHPIWVLAVGLGMNILIVGFRIQELFKTLIINILHRDLTFSYRTYIWDMAVERISKRWWIGYAKDDILTFRFSSTRIADVMPHNQFLDIMILYGIFATLLFIVMMIMTFMELGRNADRWTSKVLTAALFAMLICSITEKLTPYEPLYIIFGFCWVLPVIAERSKDLNKKKSKKIVYVWR